MTRIVNVYEAKTSFSKLLEDVAKGEEVVIARRGEPVAKLVPIDRQHRELGFERGMIWIADDFDAPIPELEDAFEG